MESRRVPVSFLATRQVEVPFNQEGVTVGGGGLHDQELRLPFCKFWLRSLLDIGMSCVGLVDVSGARKESRLET